MSDKKEELAEVVETADAATGTDAAAPSADEAPKEPQTMEELQAEIDRLRAENAAAQAANDAARASSGAFLRRFLSGTAIVVGVVILAISLGAVWLNRTIMVEDNWVNTMAPLAANASIQNYVADTAANAVFDSIDIQAEVSKVLTQLSPTAANYLSAPIASAVKGFISDAAHKVTASQQFKNIWTETMRLLHKAFIASITDRSGVISKQGGTITLDTGLLADQIKTKLVSAGVGFAANIPVTGKTITLYDSPLISQLGSAIQLMNTTALVLPILALIALALALALAVDRRKAALWIGVGIVITTALPLQGIYLAQIPVVNQLAALGKVPTDAATAAYQIVFANLIAMEQLAIVIGLVIWIGAILAGPSGWAVALRGGLRNGLTGIGATWDFGAFGEWVLAHARGLRIGGLIAAVVVLLAAPQRSISGVLWLAFALLVWLLLVTFFGRTRPEPAVAATEPAAEAPEPDGTETA